MKNNLPLRELSIRDVYESDNNITYEIPIYQRNYAWKKEQIEALIHDVWDAFKAKKDTYYIGTLVTYDKGEGRFEVIDGQQRLTTLYLILKTLGEKLKSKLTYRAREKSNKTISGLPNFDHDDIDWGIKEGFHHAKQAIDEIVSQDKKVAFANYLLQSVHIIHYNVPRDVDLNHYFEVMNSRGEQLEKHEIVKAKLMAELSDEADKTKFATIWQACSEMDTYVQLKYPQAKGVFGAQLNSFLFYGKTFDELPNVDHIVMARRPLIDFLHENLTATKMEDDAGRSKVFQPIIDFPNFLLIVLKITRMAEADFQPTDIVLDDKELINAFENAKPDDRFVKRFCFNLLQAKYLLDNYVVHHSNEDDSSETNPWQLQHWQKEKDSSHPKNLCEDRKQQDKMVQLLSMFEVSFTPRQRKNYLFYCLYHLFSNHDLNDYCTFLAALADKYFYDIYLNSALLNEINTPTPGAFDQMIVCGKDLNTRLMNTSPDFCLFGNDEEKTKGIPLFVFNYIDYRLWEKYALTLSGEKLGKESPKRKQFFAELGCSDFELNIFDHFYFSRTRRSLEHYYPQANTGDGINENQINCIGNFAMIGSEANSSGSNWTPKTKLDHYLDASKKVIQVSVASLKFRIMMQMCSDNLMSGMREAGKEWTYDDILSHQNTILRLLSAR